MLPTSRRNTSASMNNSLTWKDCEIRLMETAWLLVALAATVGSRLPALTRACGEVISTLRDLVVSGISWMLVFDVEERTCAVCQIALENAAILGKRSSGFLERARRTTVSTADQR